MRKVITLLIAMVMILSMAIPAFADETPADPLAGHTFTAYQIFSGTQTADSTDATIGSVDWGNGINAEDFLAALKGSEAFGNPNAFANCGTAAAVAEAMKSWTDGSDMAKAFAKLAENYVIGYGTPVVNKQSTLEAGYYLVVDTSEQVAEDDVYNVALLQLTKKDIFAIVPKNTVPEVVKKVNNGLTCTKADPTATNYEEGHTHGKECYDWEDSNNAALGDTVNFKIETAVPATATEYEYYFFIINDTLSDGLDFANPMNLKVYIGTDVATADDYTVKTSDRNLQIALVDAIANAGKDVTVTYDAILNTSAVIGVEGNPNAVTVDFSNNPNEDFGPDDIPTDGFPKDTTHTPKGETPKDYTLTFVSKINVYKVDENNKALQGAEFTLSGDTLNKVLVMKEQFTEAEGGTFYKLTSGSYTEEAPITADCMKDAEADATEGYVVAEDGFEGKTVTVGEVTYRAYDPSNDAGKDVYILVKANTNLYASTSVMYKREWVSETKTASGDTLKVVGAVDENGVVSFAGLPAGDYTLSETVVPAGYNPIADIKFTLAWTKTTVTAGTEECTWSVENSSSVSYNETNDAFEITVINQKGATLPETGGIGTTIFYICGSVLLIGAAILLVTKKRMSVEE